MNRNFYPFLVYSLHICKCSCMSAHVCVYIRLPNTPSMAYFLMYKNITLQKIITLKLITHGK